MFIYFGYFALVSLEFTNEFMCECVVDASGTISGRGRYVLTSVVEHDIEHFVVMADEHADALARAGVPYLACLVHASCDNRRAIPIELSAAYFGFMTDQRMHSSKN